MPCEPDPPRVANPLGGLMTMSEPLRAMAERT